MFICLKNALMPSENQQVLRLRLAYLMRRFLFLALGIGLLLPIAPKSKAFWAECFPTTAAYSIKRFMNGGGTWQEALNHVKWDYRETNECRTLLRSELRDLGYTNLPNPRQRWRK